MPLTAGVALSYSPLLYRPRDRWDEVGRHLVGDTIQPASAGLETEEILDGYHARVAAGLSRCADTLARAKLDALVVLAADDGAMFDASNVPQFHVQVGGSIQGDVAIATLGEAPDVIRLECEAEISDHLIEEIVRDGFDIAEARHAFRPVGEPERGMARAMLEASRTVVGNIPIIPVHLNCHTSPCMSGMRAHAFGEALSRAAERSKKRIGILASGGLSGDPHGAMAGWIDEILDRWVLRRLEMGRSGDVAAIWRARSRTLEGSSAEIRLWVAAAAALEAAGCKHGFSDYLPLHRAAAGIGFMTWETSSCR